MSTLRVSTWRSSAAACSSRIRLVSIMASRNTCTVRAISPISSRRSAWATGASSWPALSEAMRSFRPVSGLTMLRPTAQVTAIEISISTTITIEAVCTIDQKELSTSDMYCAEAIIRFQGAKPRVKATFSSGVGSVPLRRNE